MARYRPAKNGDLIHPNHSGYKMACCDCGLVHVMEFQVTRKTESQPDGSYVPALVDDPTLQVRFRVSRNERATAAVRREKRKKGWRGVY